MFVTIGSLVVLALTAGQADGLALANARTTYGLLGPTRPDNKFLPGDIFIVSFEVAGAKADDSNKIRYSIGLEVANDEGKVIFKQAPRESEAARPADAGRFPAAAQVQIGLDQPAGEYALKVTVTDRVAGSAKQLVRSFQVQRRGFGVVRVGLSSDPEGKRSLATLVAGKPAWINFAAVGFGRATGQPRLAVNLRVLDRDDKPALDKPPSGTVDRDISERAPAIPMQFQLVLQKAGTFRVTLEATDQVSGDKATVSFPVQVMAAK